MANLESDEQWLRRDDVAANLKSVRRLQNVLLDMLRVIDDVCSVNGLRYYLFYGTLLGAMRHKGFIPWDDDADIVMPRADYDKLLRLPKSKWPDGYFLQSPLSEKYGRFVFAKLRKDGTTCITPEHRNIKMHQGIFVDIFPLDEARGNGLGLWTLPRFFERLTAFSCVDISQRRKGVILRSLQKAWQKLMPAPSFFARLANLAAKLMSGHSGVYLDTFNTDRIKPARKGFAKALFNRPLRTEFEGIMLNVPTGAKEILSAWYGNWEVWPPETARVPVHSKDGIIDVEKDYTYYLNSKGGN